MCKMLSHGWKISIIGWFCREFQNNIILWNPSILAASGPQFPDLFKQVAALGGSLSTHAKWHINLGIVIMASLDRWPD